MASFQLRSDGSELSSADLETLKSLVKGTVVLKKEATSEEYHAAVDRWNAVSIRPAVCIFSEGTTHFTSSPLI